MYRYTNILYYMFSNQIYVANIIIPILNKSLRNLILTVPVIINMCVTNIETHPEYKNMQDISNNNNEK